MTIGLLYHTSASHTYNYAEYIRFCPQRVSDMLCQNNIWNVSEFNMSPENTLIDHSCSHQQPPTQKTNNTGDFV